jgi:hypothetical protein
MKKIIQSIQSFFKRFYKQSMTFLDKHAEVAVQVTQGLKMFFESPIPGIITKFIPGTADDVLRIALEKIIPQVAYKTAIMYKIIDESDKETDYNIVIGKIIAYLQTVHPTLLPSVWATFAADVTLALIDDGKLDLADAWMLSQKSYKVLYKKEALAG